METIEFLKNLGIMIIAVAFVGGFGYWTITLLKKVKPDFKYWFKYNVLKSKYNEQEVAKLLDYDQAGLTVNQVNKFLLVNGGIDPKRAKELCFIYRQIQLKGGINNE